MTIQDIQNRKDLALVTDSQDVNEIKAYFGNPKDWEDLDGLFVAIENGDYTEVYGFTGNVPYLGKALYKLV